MDMEFEKLKTLMPHIALSTMTAQEHVGEIEQKIRVINERARGTFITLPYKKLPKLMVIKLPHFYVMWLILFSIKSGISKNEAHKSWYLEPSWMLSYIVETCLEHIVRCILTQTSRTHWNQGQGQTGQFVWD